ncbi:MAG TPA: hypothetical protein VF993_01880 [Myxococcales bacterium]
MKNGVDRQRPAFTPWFWSGRIPAKIEGAIVICVFAAVIAIMGFLFEMPGPLVVHVQDDVKEAIKGARVRCTSPDGATAFAGQTDVFGEVKWPGLAKGAWKCEVTAPDRYHAAAQVGYATVVARHPAMWTTVVERPARLLVQVVRPTGAPRAKVAVRAVCGLETWEARAGLLDGRATLFVPHGVPCRAGLVFPELPGDGPSTQSKLDCDAQPCTAPVTGGVGQELTATLTPTPAQWALVRPPPEPDKQ